MTDDIVFCDDPACVCMEKSHQAQTPPAPTAARTELEAANDLAHLNWQRYAAAEGRAQMATIEAESLRTQLATERAAHAELRKALEEIAERSSYPIDPRDAFEDAMDRARKALRASLPSSSTVSNQ